MTKLYLRELSIVGNKIEIIPQNISCLKNLEWLSLSDNKIKELPKEISFISGLKSLTLSNNQLNKIDPIGEKYDFKKNY